VPHFKQSGALKTFDEGNVDLQKFYEAVLSSPICRWALSKRRGARRTSSNPFASGRRVFGRYIRTCRSDQAVSEGVAGPALRCARHRPAAGNWASV